MTARYIPISQHFTSNLPVSVSDDFYFTLNGREEFYVYKSRACFFSNKALKCFLQGISIFDILIQSQSANISEVSKSLYDLLNGVPLLINSSNFEVYHEIFLFVENGDFQHFFQNSPPLTQTKFYLSIYSLKPMSNEFLEKWIFQPKHLPGLSFPVGLIYLFWNLPWRIEDLDPSHDFTDQQVQNGIWILNEMKEGRFHPLEKDHIRFLHFFKFHSHLLDELSKGLDFDFSNSFQRSFSIFSQVVSSNDNTQTDFQEDFSSCSAHDDQKRVYSQIVNKDESKSIQSITFSQFESENNQLKSESSNSQK
jgi:hypothetical protein